MHLTFYILLLLLQSCTFSSADLLYQRCSVNNYTTNSAFESNLNLLLTFFSSLDSTSFATHSVGSAYGLILCRGDASPADCAGCVRGAVKDVLSICPLSKNATIWYDTCELRYSDHPFYSVFQNYNSIRFRNLKNITTNVDSFIQVQRKLLDEVTYQAAYNSSTLFATGSAVNGSGIPRVNALAQCTRDISENDCSRCLQEIREQFTSRKVEVSQGGRALGESCNFRYEVYPFYQGNPMFLLNFSAPPSAPLAVVSPPALPISDGEGSKNNTWKVLFIVLLILIFVSLVIAVSIFLWRKRAKKGLSGMANLEEISNVESLLFDLSTIKVATNNFSEENKLGEGGFGPVYKGKLAHGQEIAVKRLSTSSTQGAQELKNELLLVAKLQHRNLVKLIGVCLEEEEKLLVYEYVPNGSLDKLLFDTDKCKQLNWERRFNIIRGIARGLFYLHEESHLKVVHRDLKASNILLDSDMNPKISDFGLARLFSGDETQRMTSQVVGTYGYMAPEYVLHGHFSPKADVFSYGVLVLEIVTGTQSSSFSDSEIADDFLNYIWKHWSNGTVLEIIDPALENCSKNDVLRCIHLALLCIQEVAAERPPMSSVVVMLQSPSVPLQAPSQPRFFHGMVRPNMLEVHTDLMCSVNDVSITDMEPR